MKTTLFGIKTIGGFVAALIVATIPQMVQASEPQSNSAATLGAQSSEIASLKRQIYLCHHHKHRKACPLPQVVEKQVIIEKPVIVEKEKIVEKQVFVDRPLEKQVVFEQPVEIERRVVVEHSAHRKHLLHFGIPFISVNLF